MEQSRAERALVSSGPSSGAQLLCSAEGRLLDEVVLVTRAHLGAHYQCGRRGKEEASPGHAGQPAQLRQQSHFTSIIGDTRYRQTKGTHQLLRGSQGRLVIQALMTWEALCVDGPCLDA